MATATVEIVDRGRGPQLSTSRITVQDMLPFWREGAPNDEVRRWLPSLTDEEIAVLKDHIRDHQDEVLKTEREIKAYHDEMRAAQPEWTRATDHLSLEERQLVLRSILDQKTGKNPSDPLTPARNRVISHHSGDERDLCVCHTDLLTNPNLKAGRL